MINQPQDSSTRKKYVSVNARLLGIFANDATKTIDTLNTIMNSQDNFSEEDLKTYTISVHGIKSALAYIGENELSQEAFRLENAGREKDTQTIIEATNTFIRSLRSIVEYITSTEEEGVTDDTEDTAFLKENLLKISSAAEEYDEASINLILAELKEKNWHEKTLQLLEEISLCLLHSDFEMIVELITGSVSQ